jgi:hypothetical protein
MSNTPQVGDGRQCYSQLHSGVPVKPTSPTDSGLQNEHVACHTGPIVTCLNLVSTPVETVSAIGQL